jgi:hypothetical protein
VIIPSASTLPSDAVGNRHARAWRGIHTPDLGALLRAGRKGPRSSHATD